MNSQSHTFWERLKAHHKELGMPQKLCPDWVFNPRSDIWDLCEFRKQKERVLFVLKETYGGPFNLLVYLNKDGPRRCYWNVARWAYGILENFPLFEKVPNGREELKQYLMKVAVINLKKTPGGRNSQDNLIHIHAHHDREFLLEQIREARPTIIIACGTIIPVMWLLDLPVKPDDVTAPLRDPVTKAEVVQMQHPGAPTNLKDNYENLKKRVRRARTAE